MFKNVLKMLKTKKREADFSVLAEALPQIVWTANAAGKLNYTNARWLEYSGSDDPAAWIQFVHPDDVERVGEIWKNCVRNRTNYETELRLLRKHDLIFRWHIVRAVPIENKNDHRIHWIGTNTDTHDQKIFIQSLEKERELRDRFVATLTHDLRSPLSAAKMSAELILRRLGDAGLVEKNAKRVVSAVNRADGMIRDLLDANLIRAGGVLAIEPEECDIALIAREAIDEMISVHGERFDFICDVKIVAKVDGEAIKRMIEKVCHNSAKYGNHETEISVSVRDNQKTFLIKIHNFGKALSEQDQKYLLNPSELDDFSRVTASLGWGLGLLIVKGAVDAHKGQLHLISNDIDGTQFTIEIPKSIEN